MEILPTIIGVEKVLIDKKCSVESMKIISFIYICMSMFIEQDILVLWAFFLFYFKPFRSNI